MLNIINLTKVYTTSEIETTALSSVSFTIEPSEFVAVMGPSGCGKSTLLNCLALLDDFDSGSYTIFGKDVSNLSFKEVVALRKETIGFVFQNFNLIEDLTVQENVEVGLIYKGYSKSERNKKVRDSLKLVGLDARIKHFPSQLSGGQQQRVALARAIVSEPKIIFADEPTGNLDSENGRLIIKFLKKISRDGTTIVMVTHSLEQAKHANRIIHLLDGKVLADKRKDLND